MEKTKRVWYLTEKLRGAILLGYGVHRVDDPGDVAQNRQQQADPELRLLKNDDQLICS